MASCSRRWEVVIVALAMTAVTGPEPGSALDREPAGVVPRPPQPTLEIYPPGASKLPGSGHLRHFLAAHSDRWEVRWDTRSDRPHLIQGIGVPLLVAGDERLEQVEQRVRSFLAEVSDVLGVTGKELRFDRRRSFGFEDGSGRWLLELQQVHQGLPVAGARVFVRLNRGNVIQFGTHRIADVHLSIEPRLSIEKAISRVREAVGDDIELIAPGRLAIYPTTTLGEQDGEIYRGPPGQGYDHRLGWQLSYRSRHGGYPYRTVIDAHSGELLEHRELVRRSTGQVSGEVYGLDHEEAPVPVPLPYLTVFNPQLEITDSQGLYPYGGGLATAYLAGPFAQILDQCGDAVLSSSSGELDFGGHLGTDCDTPGFGGSGNTLAGRTAYYHLARLHAEAATQWPEDPWLQEPVLAQVNLDGSCLAYWDGAEGTVNFSRSGGGCANGGEILGLVAHEWGHGVDQAIGTTALDGASGEAVADTFAMLATGDACIGDDFRSQPCHNCAADCTGVRDLAAFSLAGDSALARPETLEDDLGVDCDRLGCPFGGSNASGYQGPLGYEAHCESYLAGSANWDLVTLLSGRHGSEEGWSTFRDLWLGGLASAGSAYRRRPGIALCENVPEAVDGCGHDNWYTVFLAVDDDDGDLDNGTPHQCQIWQAFNAHGIACGDEPECPCPSPMVVAGPDHLICDGQSVTLGGAARPGHRYRWSPDGETQATITVAPRETTTYTVIAETACGAVSDTATVVVDACGELDGDFDNGGVGWSTDGLWHVSGEPSCAPGSPSPPNVMYYGIDASCNFETGGVNRGDLISPAISQVSADTYLSFDSFRQVGPVPARDRAEVAISVVGSGVWEPRWAREAGTSEEARWTRSPGIALGPYAGDDIQVRFRFDSIDGQQNGFIGWQVDNVTLSEQQTASGNAPPEIEIEPVGSGVFDPCVCVVLSATAGDEQDGDLSQILQWTSDLEGVLGVGGTLATVLTPGVHTLSVTARDYGGEAGSASTTLVVEEPTGPCGIEPWPPASPLLYCGEDE